MSDDDFDVELLALAGDGHEMRRKKRQNSSSGKPPSAKRRKADVNVDSSDMEPESEEDESNPYPLEGKYKDAEDRARLLEMPEIERESVLAQRLEEIQRLQEGMNLDRMLGAQTGNGDAEHVSQAAKRKHAVRGATKEKTKKLDELKAKRKAKEERARDKAASPTRRQSSESEPELSDVTDEEGEINKEEEAERKYKETFGSPKAKYKLMQEDLEKLRLSRHQVAKHYYAPWFEEWIVGAWVRYLVPSNNMARTSVYRACEIIGLAPEPVKPYKVNDVAVNRMVELKHGNSVRMFPMDKISDSPFSQKEFERLVAVFEDEKVAPPSRRSIDKKCEQLRKLPERPLTEADVTAMIARKNALNPANAVMALAFNTRVQLTQRRNLALKRQDFKEAAEVDKELEALVAAQPSLNGRAKETTVDLMSKVNARNRQANLEAVRKAEAEAAARKRQERKAAAEAAARGLTPPVIFDVSARVKTVAKTHYQSRVTTPHGTPLLKTSDSVERSVSPLAPLASAPASLSFASSGSFESRVVESINIELDDF
ncbi:plus-3-domain-containing protein [Hysterangium stoloniferum]|nr:plus-3-domain-containing protein [Hysterangium stoloniferum]